MSIPILILGESGVGKSTSLRNLDPENTLLIQSINKPLPFRNKEWKKYSAEDKTGNIFVTDNSTDIVRIMKHTRRKVIVVDDYQYILANELMRRYLERGFDKFSEIGYNGWLIATEAGNLPYNTRVYILAHSHMDDNGKIKIKTPGKLLDTHSIEGMFTIVMRAICRDNSNYFTTKNNGADTVKTPIDMFESELIPNDLMQVDNTICEYYNIEETK